MKSAMLSTEKDALLKKWTRLLENKKVKAIFLYYWAVFA